MSKRRATPALSARASGSPHVRWVEASWTLIVILIGAGLLSAQRISADDPDRLYSRRTDINSARQAVDLWRELLNRSSSDFDAAWKLGRADYWLGGHVAEAERTSIWEDGVTRGRSASSLQPNRPEGHFWTAANMGALAEASTRGGIKYRKPIKEELETVLRIDPAFLQGSADRALGRWYFKVPRLFGGNKKTAEAHLRASLTYNARSTASHFFLAELMLDDGRRDEARRELQQVLDAPYDPEWDPEDQEFKTKARPLLGALK